MSGGWQPQCTAAALLPLAAQRRRVPPQTVPPRPMRLQVVCQLAAVEQLFFSLNPVQALPPTISQLQVGGCWVLAVRPLHRTLQPAGRGLWCRPSSRLAGTAPLLHEHVVFHVSCSAWSG